MRTRAAHGLGILVAVVVSTGAGLWLADIAADRRYIVAVEEPEALYELPPHEYPSANPVVGRLAKGQPLRVLRVRYGKDFEALHVELPSGQRGWVVGGRGVRVVSRG